MPIASRVAFQFDKGVQYRGFGLFRGHAVRVTDESSTHVHASVSGGIQYDVRVTLDDGRLLVSCDCVYFGEYGKCKHLWATILEADRRGALADAMSAKYLTIEDNLALDHATSFGDLSFHDRLPRRPRLPPPQPPRIPAWQEHLTTIQREIQYKQPLPAWPREFEILYMIDQPASRAAGAI